MNKEEIEEYESPYCEVCGHCGEIGCFGIRNFIDGHIKGKTNCKNEEIIINKIISLCKYKDVVFEENKQLRSQLEYIRSGEYYNQLRFERDMLQDLADKGEISKEDKEFINCTHRNTELLEENKQLKERIDEAIDYLEHIINEERALTLDEQEVWGILGGDSNE